MPGRNWVGTVGGYRYTGVNGQEKEDEIFEGASSAEYWMYDSRILRRWNTDPLGYPWQSPYMCFNGNPIYYSDPSGAISGTNTPSGGSKKAEPIYNGGNLNEVEVSYCKSCETPAAATGNGPANGQPLPKEITPQATPPGNYYQGTWMTTYNKNLAPVTNDNTWGQAQTRYLGVPTDEQYMERARGFLNSGSGSLGYKAFAVSTNGDISAGYMKRDYSSGKYNGDPNVTFNFLEESIKAGGGRGLMVSNNSISAGPINAGNETNIYTMGPDIVHMSGTIIGTVSAQFVVTNITASFYLGGFKSTVTAIQNFTPTLGKPWSRRIGTETIRGLSGSFNFGGVSVGGDIPFSK